MSALIEDLVQPTAPRVRIAPHLVAYALIALGIAGLWPSLSALVRVWLTMADYNHGFLIAGVSAVWLFNMRARIDARAGRPTLLAAPALACAVFAWMVAYRANSELMQQLVLPLAPALAVLVVFGPRMLALVAAPLGFFYFAIPIWDHFVPVLQWLTTEVTEGVLRLLGVPTIVEGHNVTIPAGQFSIIEGCSGKRYFITGLAFAALAGAMQHLRPRRFAALIALAIAAALVTNWLRVVIVIYAGHVSDMQHYLVAVEHKTLGYALFAPLLLVIAVAARRLGSHAPSYSAQPDNNQRTPVAHAAWGLSSLLLAIPVLVWALPPTAAEGKQPLGPLPIMTGAWQGPLPASDRWRPQFIAPSDERRASYLSGAHRIEVYLNSYGRQTPGQELVFHRNSIIPAEHWTLVRRMRKTADAPAMLIAHDANGERWIMARQYAVDGRVTGEPALAQLYYGVQAVWTPTPSGVVAFATPCTPDCDAAAQRLRAFWSSNGASFVGLIPTTY